MDLLPHADLLPDLTLLVHPSVGRLEEEVALLRAIHAWPILSVSHTLAHALADQPERRRGPAASRILEEALATLSGNVRLCSDLALLFEPSLQIDPLGLLLDLARHHPKLLVAWPGQLGDRTLAYAVPEHLHYRTWPRPAALAIALR